MTVWRILSFLILLTPVLTLILGLICWRYPPKGPTWALGYRSRRARASREAWQFAQNVAGQIWLCLGLTLTAVFAIVCICLRNRGVETLCQAALICIIVEDLLVFASMVPTEVLLTRRFDRLGRWREPANPRQKGAVQSKKRLGGNADESDSPRFPQALLIFRTEAQAPWVI